METEKKKRRSTKIGALVFLLIVAAVIVIVVVLRMTGGADSSLEDVDLEEYTLTEADFGGEFYVNEPLSGTLVFKNGEGDEKRVSITDEGVAVSGFNTGEIGSYTLKISVKDGAQTLDAPYSVVYKEIYFGSHGTLCLSVGDPFELDGIAVSCTDYNDHVVASVPLSDFARESDFDVDYVFNTPRTAYLEYMGADFTVDYTVGYIGYGYIYEGRKPAADSGNRYGLVEFTLDEDGTGFAEFLTEEGSYGTGSVPFDIVWEADVLDDRLELSLTDGYGSYSAWYDCKTHTLYLGADVFGTARELAFELQLAGLPRY